MKFLQRFIVIALFIMPSAFLSAEVIIKGSMTHEQTVLPGESYTGSIEVSNPEDKPQDVKIYQTDYLFYADGRVLYGAPGKIARSNADWISFSPKRLTIPPKDTVNIQYTVKVPDDKTMIGTYWSISMVGS